MAEIGKELVENEVLQFSAFPMCAHDTHDDKRHQHTRAHGFFNVSSTQRDYKMCAKCRIEAARFREEKKLLRISARAIRNF